MALKLSNHLNKFPNASSNFSGCVPPVTAMTDDFSDNSDIDLLVKFGEIPFEKYADNYFELHEIFESFFNRKVDLITENSLSNPYFIKKINQTKTVLYNG